MSGISFKQITASGQLFDISNTGLHVSYATLADSTETLWLYNLATDATTVVATTPYVHSGSGIGAATTGFAGGDPSSDGRYIFCSTGILPGALGPGPGAIQFFVQDLSAGRSAQSVTPLRPARPFPGSADNLNRCRPTASTSRTCGAAR